MVSVKSSIGTQSSAGIQGFSETSVFSGSPVVSIVLNAHIPFAASGKKPDVHQERCFFEAISETYLPLLAVFDRLDRDHIPFRMGISLSPVLCHMLNDEALIKRYLEYVDKQIEFGGREIKAAGGDEKREELIRYYYDEITEKRILFTGRYEGNLLKVFDYYQRKGRLEILTTAATCAFLPFYTSCPEAVQAELEVGIGSCRLLFGKSQQGFWLPELGWSGELEPFLRSYNFAYTIVETHGLVLGNPHAERGSFYPAKTPSGIFILGRDFYARSDIEKLSSGPASRDNCKDLGFELPPESLAPFLGSGGGRVGTGYKCWNREGRLYDPFSAGQWAEEQAELFLKNRKARLEEAASYMNGTPVSLCAFDADTFGRFWFEGPRFLEALFRRAHASGDLQFMTPAEYLFKLDPGTFQTVKPEFSSWGCNGYAETWADASNDWMYRHAMRALERMIELAERFPDNSGLRERALNQAAREILLVMASDWSKMLYRQECPEYARKEIESSLRNFTTIYEALGSNYLSTEWLTALEKRHNIFPQINYRIFRRKK